jgi:hypothetical protein
MREEFGMLKTRQPYSGSLHDPPHRIGDFGRDVMNQMLGSVASNCCEEYASCSKKPEVRKLISCLKEGH